MNNKIYVIPDCHCRDFYKPILNVKDTPIVFLGDYMDPYVYEGTDDKHGIENLEEIIDFAKNNNNVTLLVGNHDESYIWSFLGFERTSYKYYEILHKLYRDNINLFKPCLKRDGVLFTHAGVSKGWVDSINKYYEHQKSSFKVTQDNIDSYIGNEFANELIRDKCITRGLSSRYLESCIFDIGYARWGDSPYGGPFWDDFNDEYWDPEGWNLIQIMGHTQREVTGTLGINGNGFCVDSRAIFEYDIENKIVSKADVL